MAVVVAQLVDWALPTPDICGSNPIMDKFYFSSNRIKSALKIQKEKKDADSGIFF